MTTMVCFHTAGTEYCLPVESTRGVRTAADLRAIPGTASDIAGILPGQPPLTVISVLGGAGDTGGYVLVVESGDTTFGLLVDAVDGLRRIAATDIRPASTGRGRSYVSGTIDMDGRLMLVADPDALAARL
ncbi:chemotaxis protein CheW [Cryobacterium sp. GrIS_2_6]|uniref:chemotaxis protein CheW n=1 Tax=Cryobacterium sp. GrIS_2_6 TaxID=3162785 RepID=UPI002E069051|nr:chemotaxis signal transduction protein [Cryobacterium psychrotolerans]